MGVKMFAIIVILILGLAQSVRCSDDAAISPADYREIIKEGFATNWFKTPVPMEIYHHENIEDIYAKGFRNVRLRSRADLYAPPYTAVNFTWFLGNLTVVVDKCLETGVAPIISWVNHDTEAYSNENDRKDYVTWWTAVASHLKDRHYNLSFNLFTELGVDGCGGDAKAPACRESLRMRPDKYNNWTAAVVKAIRATGGKNAKRILILASPGKTGKELHKIDPEIYKNDKHMLAEWHIYASGPNKRDGSAKYWSGDGIPEGRKNVKKAFKPAIEFTKNSGVLTYFGAWMPTDNKAGSLNQTEVINFARYIVCTLKKNEVPWSLNVLDRYYDTAKMEWLTDLQDIKGRMFNMSLVLDNIKEVMQARGVPSLCSDTTDPFNKAVTVPLSFVVTLSMSFCVVVISSFV